MGVSRPAQQKKEKQSKTAANRKPNETRTTETSTTTTTTMTTKAECERIFEKKEPSAPSSPEACTPTQHNHDGCPQRQWKRGNADGQNVQRKAGEGKKQKITGKSIMLETITATMHPSTTMVCIRV